MFLHFGDRPFMLHVSILFIFNLSQTVYAAKIATRHQKAGTPVSSCNDGGRGGGGSLENATFQMISYHQNAGNTFEQVMTNFNHSKSDKPDEITDRIDICLEWLQNKALQSQKTLELTASDFCARKIVEISKDGKLKDSQELLCIDKSNLLKIVIGVIHSLKASFDPTFFLKYICSQVPRFPLEVLWTLHIQNIMTLDSYLQHSVADLSICQEISAAIIDLCKCSNLQTLEKRKEIVKVISGVLVNEAFPFNSNQLSSSINKEAQKILDLLISSILELNENEILSMLPIELAIEYKLINREALHKTCIQQLTFLLGHKPCFTVSDAIQKQDQWTYSKLSPFQKALFKQFFIVLDADSVLTIIRNILESEEFNWKRVLSFTATYLICFREAPTLLKNYINDTLKYGIDCAEIDSTTIAFLFARQGCYEGPYVFGTYPDWFEITFGSSSKSLANSRKSFTFLLKFLSDLVPFESAIHLKAHLMKPPFIPALCKPIYAEYSTLAKTRLLDLKEPISSVFSVGADEIMDKKMKMKKAAADVDKAVAAFESSGKIPANVMETTIFRRPYFVGYFIPALLRPRTVPHKADAKMKFIKSLKEAGKIPLRLYNNYIKACKEHMSPCKIDSIAMDEEVMPTDPNVPLLQKLQPVLNDFVAAVSNPNSTATGSSGNKVSESLSSLSEFLKMVSPEWNSNQTSVTTCDTIVLDLKSPSLEEKHVQVIEVLLNAVSQAAFAVYSFPRPDYTWALQFMQSLSVHLALLPALFFSLWRLVSLEYDKLSDEQIISLGSILSHVSLSQHYFPQVQFEGHPKSKKLKGNFCEILWESLPCSHQKQMTTILRLSSTFLKTTFYSLSDLTASKIDSIPTNLVKKYVYLCERFYPETRLDADLSQCWREEVIIYKSEAFALLKSKCKLTLKDWLSFELSIDPESDSICLRERRLYQNWMLLHFQNLEEETNGMNNICSTIFKSLLDAIVESSNEPKFQKCSKCHQDFSEQKDKFRNKHEIFLLLQKSLKQFMVQSQDDYNPVPWLLNELKSVTNIETGWNKQRLTLNALIGSELMLSLPAHLLFTDSLSIAPSDSAIHALIAIINTVLKDNLNEGFTLSSNFTLHIFQGFESVKDLLSANCLQRLVKSCPLLWSSFLVHGEFWGYTPNVLSDVGSSNNLSKMLKSISTFWNHKDWWKDRHLISEMPVNLIAASLATVMIEQNILLQEIELQNLGKEISCASFACLLSKIAQYILNYRTVPSSLLQTSGQILMTSPWLFLSLSKEPSPARHESITSILPVSSLTFRCIVVFRVLMEGCDFKSVCNFVCSDSVLDILLELHQDITELYDKTEGMKVHSENVPYCSHLKPLTMHDILNVASFVKKIVSGVSLHALRQASPKIWQASDVDIQQVFKARLYRKND